MQTEADEMSKSHERAMDKARKLIPVLNWSEAERIANLPDRPVVNTDRELFREVKDDYYSPSLRVTENGMIGIDVGGFVRVMSLRDWHRMAKIADLSLILCKELQSPAMEYLNEHIQNAWSNVFNAIENKS